MFWPGVVEPTYAKFNEQNKVVCLLFQLKRIRKPMMRREPTSVPTSIKSNDLSFSFVFNMMACGNHILPTSDCRSVRSVPLVHSVRSVRSVHAPPGHSVENMFAEVTLLNDSELSKNYQKLAKMSKKFQKLSKNCLKLPKIA